MDKDAVRAEKERIAALVEKARAGGGGGGGGGGEEEQAVAVARAVRAVEDDFM